MSLNFGIYWASATEGYSIPEHTIDSDDPNELYETGYRKIYKPFPEGNGIHNGTSDGCKGCYWYDVKDFVIKEKKYIMEQIVLKYED